MTEIGESSEQEEERPPTVNHRYLFVFLTFFASSLNSAADAADVWYAGVRSPDKPHAGLLPQTDYMSLFSDNSNWAHAAQTIKVFQTSSQFLLNAPDSALITLFKGLAERHIQLAVETLILRKSVNCGDGVEGFDDPNAVRAWAEKAQRLVGVIDYASMDEPLWYGSIYTGPNSCKWSIAEVAQRASENISVLEHVFPSIRVGDIEPLGRDHIWLKELAEWTVLISLYTKHPLAYLHLDMDWQGPWRPQLDALIPLLRASGTPFGIIYNGDWTDKTDEAWCATAEKRFSSYEDNPIRYPDHAIFQTWMPHPSHNLPEDQLGTLTNLVDKYSAEPTVLGLARKDGNIIGELNSISRVPLPHEEVNIYAVDNGSVNITEVRRISDIVPNNARWAVIGLRLNTECNCLSSAEISIGNILYQEADLGRDYRRNITLPVGRASVSATSGALLFHVMVSKGQSVSVNSTEIQVIPAHQFLLEVPLHATPQSQEAGYLAIIFLAQDRKEIARFKIKLTPGRMLIAKTVTGANGMFSVKPTFAINATSYFASYAGDTNYRAAESFLK